MSESQTDDDGRIRDLLEGGDLVAGDYQLAFDVGGYTDDADAFFQSMAVALRIGLRYAVGGPLGMVLTVAAGASMVAYFIRNQKDILRKVQKYKLVIADLEKKYSETQSGWRDGKYGVPDRNLMIDGLMKQFLTQVDEA